MVLLIGSLIAWNFVPLADLSSIFSSGENIQKGSGTIVESTSTGATGKSSDSKTSGHIVENRFTYVIKGETFESTSYGLNETLAPGDELKIEHPLAHPERAVIVGMRANTYSPQVLLVLIIPLIGMILSYFAIKRSLRLVNLLKQGEIAFASMVGKEGTNTTINEQPVYRYTFEFSDKLGNKCKTKVSTHHSGIFTYSGDPEARKERVLYDPKNPSYAKLLDLLPNGVRFDISDKLLRGRMPIAILILPGITVWVNVYRALKFLI